MTQERSWRARSWLGRRALATAGALLLVVLAGGGGLWWFSRVDVNSGWLRGVVTAQAREVVPGLTLAPGALHARRIPWRDSIEVTASDTRFTYHDDIAGTVDRIVLELNDGVIFGRTAVLKSLSVHGASARARWTADTLERLLARQDERGPARFPWMTGLREVTLSDLALRLDGGSPRTRHQLRLDKLTIAASNDTGDLRIRGKARLLGSNDARADVGVDGTAVPQGRWTLAGTVSVQDPSALLGPAAPALKGVDLRGGLDIDLTVKGDRDIMVDGTATLRGATLALDQRWQTPVALDGTMPFQWNGEAGALNLNEARLRSGGVRLAATARWHAAEGSAIQAALSEVRVADLHRLWPAGVAEGGRQWVIANVADGRVNTARLGYSRDAAGQEAVQLDFDYQGLTVHYRRPMPPVLDGAGHAVLEGSTLRFTIDKGRINGLDVKGSQVRLVNLGRDGEAATIDLAGRGVVRNLLHVLDSPPLGYISAFGLKPADVGGAFTLRGGIRIPLLVDVRMDQVTFNARANGKALSVPDVLDGHDLKDGDMVVTVDGNGLTATGTGRIGPQMAHIRWRESFDAKASRPSRYQINASTDLDRLRALGVDLGNLIEGPIGLSLDLAGRGQTIDDGRVTADFKDALIVLPGLGVSKAIGQPGATRLSLTRQNDRYRIDDLVVSLPGFSLSGRGEMNPGAGTRRWFLKRIQTREFTASADIIDTDDKPTLVTVRGDSFDLKPMLGRLFAPAARPGPPPAGPGSRWPDMKGTARFDDVRMYNDESLEGAEIAFETGGNLLSQLSFTAKLGPSERISATVRSLGTTRQFAIESPDAGRLARAFDIYNSGANGRLVVQGTARGTGATLELDGHARMTDFRVSQAPGLAKLLTIASLTGLRDTLQGRGIVFETVKVPFSLRNGVITLKNASAVGPAMGITMEGQFQQSLHQSNLKGVIVPSYTLNSLLGKIPLVGRLVVGGRHEGVIGFNYRIEGNALNPKVSVNPASGLAPGFLRHLFSGGPAKVASEPATD